jgi:diadenosine tetraphosphatase ApaH/serine/threonine PP2A family protein phosphatase
MGPTALISDVHSNLEALTAVLREIDARGVKEVFCLGDVVGYGPEPEPVVDLIRSRCSLVLRGNHDDAVFKGAEDFNPIARQALETNREMLRPGLFRPAEKRARWNFLRDLPTTELRGDHLFFHGSPRDPVREYVMRTDVVFEPQKMEEIFAMLPRLGFGGHTHQPGVFVHGDGHRVPDDVGGRYEFGREKAFVNIGSVGQPRDGNTAACFAILHDTFVEWVRVPYDVAAVQAKIRRTRGIDELCAERLSLGR